MKKWFVFLLFLLALVRIGIGPISLEAAGIKAPPTPTPSHQETIIESVSAKLLTVMTQTLSSKGKVLQKTSKAFAISPFTEVNVNGQRATVAELKPGMKVSVTAGTDSKQAARINANG